MDPLMVFDCQKQVTGLAWLLPLLHEPEPSARASLFASKLPVWRARKWRCARLPLERLHQGS